MIHPNIREKKLELFTLSGSQINRTMQFLFDMAGITSVNVEAQSVLEIKTSKAEFKSSAGGQLHRFLQSISKTKNRSFTRHYGVFQVG